MLPMTENGKSARTKSSVRFSAIGIWEIHRLYSIAFLLTSASLMREKHRPSYMDFAASFSLIQYSSTLRNFLADRIFLHQKGENCQQNQRRNAPTAHHTCSFVSRTLRSRAAKNSGTSIQANPFASGRRLKHLSVLQLTDVFIHSDAVLEQVSV